MPKVLIVEDQFNQRRSLVYILSDHGYDVIEASNGKTALKQATLDEPDIILLDARLPDLDGFAVLRQLRANTETVNIPVIMLTALPPAAGEQDAMKLGVTHYLTKPCDPDLLILTVRVCVREAQDTLNKR